MPQQVNRSSNPLSTPAPRSKSIELKLQSRNPSESQLLFVKRDSVMNAMQKAQMIGGVCKPHPSDNKETKQRRAERAKLLSDAQKLLGTTEMEMQSLFERFCRAREGAKMQVGRMLGIQ